MLILTAGCGRRAVDLMDQADAWMGFDGIVGSFNLDVGII